jgi:hypothetical protein
MERFVAVCLHTGQLLAALSEAVMHGEQKAWAQGS